MEELNETYDKILKNYNPNGERLNSVVYSELRKKIIDGDEISLDKLKLLTFNYIGEVLKKYYIEKFLDPQNFEDALFGIYCDIERFSIFNKCCKHVYFVFYKQNVDRSIHMKMETRLKDEQIEAESIIYTSANFPEIEDISSRAEDECYVKEDIRLIRNKIKNYDCSDSTKNILLDIFDNGYSDTELADKYGVSRQRVSEIYYEKYTRIQRYAERVINK